MVPPQCASAGPSYRFPSSIVNANDDGNADSTGATPDYWINSQYLCFGYTIKLNGRVYAIFEDTNSGGTVFHIPYDPAFDDLSALLPLSVRSTSDKMENGTAENFCFAEGTMIETSIGRAWSRR